MSGSKKSIKRLRVSQVCTNCKNKKIKCDKTRPRCSNCIKYSLNCEYPTIKWMNNDENIQGNALKKEIEDLKRQIKQYETLHVSPPATPVDFHIDFYQHPNQVVNSGEDNIGGIIKPLGYLSTLRRDPYLSFFICYICLSASFYSHEAEFNPDGLNQWMIFLDTNNEDLTVAQSLKLLTEDRKILLSPVVNTEVEINTLKKQIDDVLPDFSVINEYLNYFFRYVHPLRPYLNEAEFRLKFKIFSHNKLNIGNEGSLLFICTLLVVLRYSYITIQLMDTKYKSDINISLLLDNPIKVEAFVIVKRIFPSFNFENFPTIETLQLLLYYATYLEDCPEDGNAVSVDQSYNLFGLIVQTCLSLGLNKDSNNDLKRSIWFSIMNINAFNCAVLGNMSAAPDPCSVNVKFIQSKDVLISAINQEFIKEKKLNEIYLEISKIVNNLVQKTSFLRLRKLINDSEDYLEDTYSLKKLIDLEPYISGSQSYIAMCLHNTKIISKQLTQINLTIQVYTTICNHAESKSNFNKELYNDYYLKGLKLTIKFRDLFGALVHGNFSNFIDEAHYFELLPIFHKCIQRSYNFTMATELRLYHSLELNDKNLLNTEFLEAMCKNDDYFLFYFREVFAKKYFNGIRLFSSGKYSISLMRRYRFRCMGKILKFLENMKSNHESIKNSVIFNFYKEWISSDNDSIMNINHKNLFINELEPHYVRQCIDIWKNGYVHCPQLPQLIRETRSDPISMNENKIISRVIEKTENQVEAEITSKERQTFEMDPIEQDLELFNQVFKDLENFNAESFNLDSFFGGV